MSKYKEAMERLVVTDDMRARVLSNLQAADSQAAHKVTSLRSYKKYLYLAACVAILLIGTLTISTVIDRDTPQPNDFVHTPTNEITAQNTAAELSAAVGFSVPTLSSLPFAVSETGYLSYWGELAQISYRGTEQTLVFRMSRGADDNSGDFNPYDTETEVTVLNTPVTLKGNAALYHLAIWTDGQYSYSMKLSTGVSQEEMIALVQLVETP